MTGAFVIGSLSDRFGRYRMLLISTILTPILMVLFLQSSTAWKIPLLNFTWILIDLSSSRDHGDCYGKFL